MSVWGDQDQVTNRAIGHVVQVQGGAHDLARFSIVQINPEIAASLLAKRRPTSKRNPAAVASYAQSMRNGEWVLNGMPIILSRDGFLLDGLQRLHACVEAATSFITVLAENVPDDTVHTIDQQRRRSFTGVLETRGIPHPAAVASLLAKLIRYEDGTLTRGTSTPPWSRMERALEANRDEIDTAVKFSFDHPARLLSEAIRTPLSFMGLQVDRTRDPPLPGRDCPPGPVRGRRAGRHGPPPARGGPRRPGPAPPVGDVVCDLYQGIERHDGRHAQRRLCLAGHRPQQADAARNFRA